MPNRRNLMTFPVVDLLLVNLSLRLVIVMASPQVQQDFSKCVSGESDKFGALFPSWYKIPCLECVCITENDSEKCQVRRTQCPSKKCVVFDPKYSKCCRVCKSCFHNGTSYKDGDIWSHRQQPCQKSICRQGIISQYLERCHSNSTSQVNGAKDSKSCCFSSTASKANASTSLQPIEEHQSRNDPCTFCRNVNGTSICRIKACPVLPCASLKPKDPTKCCQECHESSYVPTFVPEKWCLIIGKQVEDGKWLRVSGCQLCQCVNGTAICQITTCPKLNCKLENHIYSGKACCPKCRDTSVCIFMGKKYLNGDKLYLKGCVECSCKSGKNYCRRQLCKDEPRRCPRGKTLGYKVGSCCKICVEKQHHCLTYGDPHYQTFDGKFYSFQGTCKYYFTKESNNTFTVQVRNSERYTGRFSWTKAVLLKFGKYSISLQQKLKVRVNGRRVRTPFLDYPVLDIRENKRYVNVYTDIGLSLTWDGDSYLSVTLPEVYKNRVNGLCGNFNGNSKDDLNLKNGRRGSPKTFAAQWLVGKDPSCHKMYKAAFLPINRCRGFKLLHAHKICRVFRDRRLRKCHSKVNPSVYHQSCVFDVCECPFNRRCECGAIKAYMSECKRRIKGKVRWRSEDICDAQCAGGSRFSYCGPACKPTCKTYRKRQRCYKPCVQGCHCNAGYVWHRNRCIRPQMCPRK